MRGCAICLHTLKSGDLLFVYLHFLILFIRLCLLLYPVDRFDLPWSLALKIACFHLLLLLLQQQLDSSLHWPNRSKALHWQRTPFMSSGPIKQAPTAFCGWETTVSALNVCTPPAVKSYTRLPIFPSTSSPLISRFWARRPRLPGISLFDMARTTQIHMSVDSLLNSSSAMNRANRARNFDSTIWCLRHGRPMNTN